MSRIICDAMTSEVTCTLASRNEHFLKGGGRKKVKGGGDNLRLGIEWKTTFKGLDSLLSAVGPSSYYYIIIVAGFGIVSIHAN